MTGKMRNIRIIAIALCMTFLFCVPAPAAQEPIFRLDMDSLNLQKGVSINLVVSMANAQGARVTSIEGIENFEVLSQTQSTSASFGGGSTVYQEDHYYTVIAKATGQFTLKANIQYNGKSYETNVLEVTVGEGSAGGGEAASDLFVKTEISHTEAYLGEKVVVTYELYSRYNIENFGFTDYVAIDGVISKDMPEDQLMGEYVYLDGNKYVKYEVKQMIIDPIKSGVYTIPSFNLQVNIITSGGMGGGFGAFFNSSRPMYLQTQTTELTVKPLPTEGRPKDFSGIVGELQLDGYYSREEMNYGDSFTLQATASGNCNLDVLRNLINREISGFTVYETQKDAEESVRDYQYHIQKAFEVILVPEKTGALDMEPISVSYFNPVTEKYEKAEIPGATINVLGDIPQPNGGWGGQEAAIQTVRIDQVSYADADDNYVTVQLKKETVYGILIGLIAIIVIAAVLLYLASAREKQDATLKSLYKQLMGAKDINEIYSLFNAMIKHRYKLSLKASSQSAVRNSLPNAELAAQVADIMDYMESPKAREEKGHIYLRDKVKGVYRMISVSAAIN